MPFENSAALGIVTMFIALLMSSHFAAVLVEKSNFIRL